MDKTMQSWGILWTTVASVLLITTLGPIGICCFIFSLVCFIGGIVAMVCQDAKHNSETRLYCLKSEFKKRKNPGIEKVLKTDFGWARFENETRLTGSASIDASLKECLEYLIRDYVKYWYNDLSDDDDFLFNLKTTLNEVVRIFSSRAKQVNWQTYLTTTLVDDFASHVRLYRKAQEKITKLQDVANSWKQRVNAMKGNDSSSESQDNISISSNNTSQQTKPGGDNQNDHCPTIIDVFFECEINVEKVCREIVSCDKEKQLAYFQEFSEVLLYLLLPAKELHCLPLKALLKEILVQGVFIPLLRLYSDPDYLNQYINWLISDNCLTSEAFLVVSRHSQEVSELQAVRDLSDQEIARTRARDDVGDDPAVKQQLSSMEYVRNLCENRINKLQRGEMDYENDFDPSIDTLMADKSSKLYKLPLSSTLRNNIALQFFIEFMQSVEGQAYLFFWLTVDGYRASAEQQLNAVKMQQLSGQVKGTPDMEMLRAIGRNIYEQYLSKNASPRVELDPITDKEILRRLSNEEPSPNVFDELQKKVFIIMQRDEKLYPAFMKSPLYIKLLAELDLLRDPSSQSTEEQNGNGTIPDPVEDLQPDTVEAEETGSKFNAIITQTGICTEHGKSYALFAISVMRYWQSPDGTMKQDKWDTFRRFSEFSDLHQSLREHGSPLGNLRLPSKTIFKDLNEEFLEKRRSDLNLYLKSILSLQHPPKAMESIHTFLDAKAYQKNNRTLKKKVDSVMRSSVRSVTNFVMNAPDQLIDGFHKAQDKVSGGIQKMSIRKNGGTDNYLNEDGLLFDDCRLLEQLGTNEATSDNIPLRIILLLMDEVFDLKHRNQWLRRQIVAALQQLVRAVFGDRMNRKIREYVDNVVAPEQVVDYICRFRDSFWPSGILAEKPSEREDSTKMRTRVLTKSKLLGAIPDELRPLVGNETTRRGVMRVFELFQHKELNTRLFIVLVEGFMETLFAGNKFKELFRKFHSNSPKMRARKRERMSRVPLANRRPTSRRTQRYKK